jgi:N-acetylmuramic acid 6-phosphate etherase
MRDERDAAAAKTRRSLGDEHVETGPDARHAGDDPRRSVAAWQSDTMRGMASRVRYEALLTEKVNRATRDLDRLPPLRVARLMNREDQRAVAAVGRVAPQIAAAVALIAQALAGGGRLIFVGAGTSGRLGVLEAAECPPTFGTSPRLVQAIMAGGRGSVFSSREGAEDDAVAAARAVRARVRAGDVVVGVSASGVTPFVRAALAAAAARGAATVLVACNPRARARIRADVVITPAPGPEVLTGSTRLKAGTATKLVLNTLTTASMARLGKVYGNRMVDLQPRSRKLQERALRLVMELGGVSRARARRLLADGGSVRVAIVMARTGRSATDARRALRDAGNFLAPLIGRASTSR